VFAQSLSETLNYPYDLIPNIDIPVLLGRESVGTGQQPGVTKIPFTPPDTVRAKLLKETCPRAAQCHVGDGLCPYGDRDPKETAPSHRPRDTRYLDDACTGWIGNKRIQTARQIAFGVLLPSRFLPALATAVTFTLDRNIVQEDRIEQNEEVSWPGLAWWCTLDG